MLCQGWKMGTFSTVKSGMSPIILLTGTLVPHKFEINNSSMIELTPEKLLVSPYFPMWWVICPHFSKISAEHCILLQISKFMGPTQMSAQMGPMLAPWTFLSGMIYTTVLCDHIHRHLNLDLVNLGPISLTFLPSQFTFDGNFTLLSSRF